MSEADVEDLPRDESSGIGDGATDEISAKRAARREEMRKKWLEKRKAEEEAAEAAREAETPLEKLVEVALTPTYIAVGGAIIVYRKIMGLPPVSVDDYE